MVVHVAEPARKRPLRLLRQVSLILEHQHAALDEGGLDGGPGVVIELRQVHARDHVPEAQRRVDRAPLHWRWAFCRSAASCGGWTLLPLRL